MEKQQKNFAAIADQFQIKIVNKRKHIVSSHIHRIDKTNLGKIYPQPNYMGTGMALVGVLHNQTFDQFKKSWVERKLKQLD